jgi:hypothetical protein
MCSNAFPKVGQLAAGVVSLIICRRLPSPSDTLDADMFITSAARVLDEGFMLVHNTDVRSNYTLASWPFSIFYPLPQRWTAQHEPYSGSRGALNDNFRQHLSYCHTCGWRTRRFLIKLNLEFPELLSAKILMEPLLYRDGDMTPAMYYRLPTKVETRVLKQRPCRFAVAGALEILAWWGTCGRLVHRND